MEKYELEHRFKSSANFFCWLLGQSEFWLRDKDPWFFNWFPLLKQKAIDWPLDANSQSGKSAVVWVWVPRTLTIFIFCSVRLSGNSRNEKKDDSFWKLPRNVDWGPDARIELLCNSTKVRFSTAGFPNFGIRVSQNEVFRQKQ